MNRLVKVVLLVGFFVASSLAAHSQTYIKTNALYWLGLLPNAQVETRLASEFTFQGEVNGSLWTINDAPMQGVQFIVGARWYPKGAFNGFYVGGDLGFDIYSVSKWNYWNSSSDFNYVQHGIGWYLGVTLGYQLSISKRWNMDFYAGGGWHLGKYWGEKVYDNGCSEMYASWNASGEWIPYKLGVSFAFRL